jgi:ribose 5-phosphate isomerase B
LIERLEGLGHAVSDFGTNSDEPVDYPPFCAAVARAVVGGDAERGIVLGGSGQGEAMAANKVRGARAALCNTADLARLAREHNDANILAMGGRIVGNDEAVAILGVFLSTDFEGGRHVPRLEKIAAIEDEECL